MKLLFIKSCFTKEKVVYEDMLKKEVETIRSSVDKIVNLCYLSSISTVDSYVDVVWSYIWLIHDRAGRNNVWMIIFD